MILWYFVFEKKIFIGIQFVGIWGPRVSPWTGLHYRVPPGLCRPPLGSRCAHQVLRNVVGVAYIGEVRCAHAALAFLHIFELQNTGVFLLNIDDTRGRYGAVCVVISYAPKQGAV